MTKSVDKKLQITKRCHWVPQAYLRTFAADTSHRKIWRFSKENEGGEPELKAIEKVAVRFYLYAPKDPITGVPDDTMERKLSELERFFGESVWKSLSEDRPDFSWAPLKKILSLIVAVMQFRNPAHFDRHKEVHQQIVDAIAKKESIPQALVYRGQTFTLKQDSWPSFQNASEADLHRSWLAEVGSATWYAEELLKMRWTILCADNPTFITSDNPVTILHPSLHFRGLADPESMVIFPISPRRLLTIDHRHGEPADAYYQLSGDGAAQNMLIWRGANEHMLTGRDPYDVFREFLDLERHI